MHVLSVHSHECNSLDLPVDKSIRQELLLKLARGVDPRMIRDDLDKLDGDKSHPKVTIKYLKRLREYYDWVHVGETAGAHDLLCWLDQAHRCQQRASLAAMV